MSSAYGTLGMCALFSFATNETLIAAPSGSHNLELGVKCITPAAARRLLRGWDGRTRAYTTAFFCLAVGRARPPFTVWTTSPAYSPKPVPRFYMPQVFRSVGRLTCFDISKNMLKRTRDAVGEEPCAGGEKVGPRPPDLSMDAVVLPARPCNLRENLRRAVTG